MSQADLARKTGLTRATISDYENRKRVNPETGALSSISIALGFPDDYLPRLAGQLPSSENRPDDETLNRIDHLYNTLKDPSNKARALEYTEFLIQLEEKNARRRSKP